MSFRIIEAPARSQTGARDQENKITRGRVRTFTLDAFSAGSDDEDARLYLKSERGVFEGATWPGDSRFFCDSIGVSQTGPISYEITANYKTIPYTEEDNPNAQPGIEPTKISISTINSQVEIDTDIEGDPLANSVGDAYQGLTKDVGDVVITLQKKYDVFRIEDFYQYINTVNDETFLGMEAGILRVTGITANQVIEAERRYWDVTVQLTARKPLAKDVEPELAWDLRIRCEGMNCIRDSKYQACIDEIGEPVTVPAPLDKTTGEQLSPTDPVQFYRFQIYETSNFAGMNLGVT